MSNSPDNDERKPALPTVRMDVSKPEATINFSPLTLGGSSAPDNSAIVIEQTEVLSAEMIALGQYSSRPRHAFTGPERVHVPGYEILSELGRGAMGVVYKARHLGLQRLVALKMILAGEHAGEVALARFRAEAESVARLQHPNIVQIYETGQHDGRPYFSLEFVDGGSLEDQIKQSPTTPRSAAELIETLARTMDVAHQCGIVHRDLKPANILMALAGNQSTEFRKEQASASTISGSNWTRGVVPKIADFGLAKRVDGDSSQTQSGTVLGTPAYMAPEQAKGTIREVGPAADIYSLGAILYELLTSRPPFKAGTPIDTIRQVIEQEPVPPRQFDPQVPRDLETICLKCLQKEPLRRYVRAEELADDLRRFLDNEPIFARPVPTWERAWKWGRRRPTTVALLGVIVAAVVSMGLFVVWHNYSLRGQLEQARAEERAAKQREQEAIEDRRLSRVQSEGQRLIDEAGLAAAAGKWSDARLQLTKALTNFGGDPRLQALSDSAQSLLEKVEHELTVESGRRTSEERFREFARLRDEAQFLGTLYTGMDLRANLKATHDMVAQALAVYGIPLEGTTAPALDVYLSESQQAEILGDHFLLMLIMAETNTQLATELPTTEQEPLLRSALLNLEQALRFGVPSRAFHLRRSRYLRLLQDEVGASQADRAAAAASPVQVLDHFLVADEFYRRANFDEAIQGFNHVLQLKPAHFWAQYLNSLCLLRQGRAAEARAQLTGCLALRSDFVWIYLLRGFAQGELKAFEAAEADFQKALELPLDEFARYVLFVNRGVLRVRQERFDDAIADMNTAIGLKPNEYQAHVNLANAYRGIKQPDLAVAALNRALEIEPGLAQLYRLRARLYQEQHKPALALRDFDQAILRENTDSSFRADDHVERGRLLLQEQDYTAALESFDTALQWKQDHSLAQRLRAEALFHLGRHREVIATFDHYLVAGKPLESVYRGRGLAKTELGDYAGAIEDYTRALELQPSSAVQTYRGWAHLLCDAPKLALRDFELAIQLDPKNADAYNSRGLVLVSQGHYREAIRDADEALRHAPPSPRLLYNAARIHAQCIGYNEQRVFELIRQALELLPAAERPGFWSTYIQTDAALKGIRKFPLYEQLEAEMSGRSQARQGS